MTEIRNPSMDIFRHYVPDIAGFIEKGHKPGQSCICTGKIRHKGQSTLIGQFEFVKTLIPEERWGEIKLTMIAPPWYHLRYKDGLAYPKDVYANDDEYFWDIVGAPVISTVFHFMSLCFYSCSLTIPYNGLLSSRSPPDFLY